MNSNPVSAPPPNLRIVPVDAVLPHEEGDVQRSRPLMARLRQAKFFTNPPIVAASADDRYVLMDGSNRHISLKSLGYPHILAQIADYDSDCVELSLWQHVVADWDAERLLRRLSELQNIELKAGGDSKAIAQLLLRDGQLYSLKWPGHSLAQRNASLRQVVEAYHSNATLYRTPLTDPGLIWSLFPSGLALVTFRPYQPQDILDSALQGAYLPPGVSRHIIQGRALNLNYPMESLRSSLSLAIKNEQLQEWLRQQYARRSVRYYAEATYHFDE